MGSATPQSFVRRKRNQPEIEATDRAGAWEAGRESAWMLTRARQMALRELNAYSHYGQLSCAIGRSIWESQCGANAYAAPERSFLRRAPTTISSSETATWRPNQSFSALSLAVSRLTSVHPVPTRW